MKQFIKIVVILFAIFLPSSRICAQGISAQVSSKKVQVGVPFEYAVVISGASSNYNQPQFRDFEIVSGPNQSSSMQYVNGVINQQMIFSYGLVARKEGKYQIGSANAIVNGQRMETQAIIIEATKNPAAAQQTDESGKKSSTDDLFIKTTVSKSKCYIGEQITIIQKVYSRHQIVGYQRSPQSSYDGFYSQPLESPTKGQLVMENVNGVNYFTHETIRTLATANKSGKITLLPVEAEVVVRRQSAARPRNIWEQLLGGGGYEDVALPAKSRSTMIEVLPLPTEGRSESFSGAVGVFTSRVEISRSELKANEALNLKITILGKGNFRFLEAPKLELPESFETYDPKVTETAGSKVFDFLIIPRREGEYDLKGIDFSYFSLDSKKYIVLDGPSPHIKVLPGVAGSEGAQVYAAQKQIKETENDIRYIKKGSFVLNRAQDEFFNSKKHLILLLVPLLLLIAALFLRQQQIRGNSDVVLVRMKKAAGMARKRLVNAEKMMKLGKKDEFYTEALLALNNYLSFRLNIAVSDLSKEKIQEVLLTKKIDAALLDKLMQTLQAGEFAKYAPGSLSGDLQAVYQDTVSLVTEIENQLSRK